MKILELIFNTVGAKTFKITVDNPKEALSEAAVREAMDNILAMNLIISSSGELASIKEARTVERTVQEIVNG